jgi:hypothetical protein
MKYERLSEESLTFKILVFESTAIYTFASGPISFVKIASLNHKILDDTMEGRRLVAKTLLTGAKGTEVLCSLQYYGQP